MNPGPGDLGPLQVRGSRGFERHHDLGRDVARRHADGLRELERDVRGEVAVTGVLRRCQRDAVRRLGEAGVGKGNSQGPEELVTDHERLRQRVERTPHRIAAS